jgi:hypothetical protein
LMKGHKQGMMMHEEMPSMMQGKTDTPMMKH